MAYQQGGFYWNPQAKQAQQFWGGKLGPPGQIMNPAQRGGGGSSGGGRSGGGSSSGGGRPSGGGSSPARSVSSYRPPPPPPPPPKPPALAERDKPSFNLGTSPTAGASASLRQGVPAAPRQTQSMTAHPQSVAATLEKKPAPSTRQLNTAHPNVSTATADAIAHGANPSVLAMAQKFLGARDYIGYCQSFVEKVSGSGWKGTSAIDAWNREKNKVRGTQGIQPGDKVYFSPNASNRGFGHVGIYEGNNQFISATDIGIKRFDLGQWLQQTGQKLLGYIPTLERMMNVGPQFVQQVLASQPKAPQIPSQAPNMLQQAGQTRPVISPVQQGQLAQAMAQPQTPQLPQLAAKAGEKPAYKTPKERRRKKTGGYV